MTALEWVAVAIVTMLAVMAVGVAVMRAADRGVLDENPSCPACNHPASEHYVAACGDLPWAGCGHRDHVGPAITVVCDCEGWPT